MTTADQASSIPTSRKVLCVVYGAIAVAALIGTWSQSAPCIRSAADYFNFIVHFWRDTKVTPVSRLVAHADCRSVRRRWHFTPRAELVQRVRAQFVLGRVDEALPSMPGPRIVCAASAGEVRLWICMHTS
jgi:hypothetical protein